MILVNLARSYPAVARAIARLTRAPRPADLADLEAITLGDWYRISEASITAYADLIAGTYGGRIVSIYTATGHQRTEDQTVRFTGRPATSWTPLIGQPQPLGPRKRGEARGTRYVDSASCTDYTDDTARISDWRPAVLDAARQALDPDGPTAPLPQARR